MMVAVNKTLKPLSLMSDSAMQSLENLLNLTCDSQDCLRRTCDSKTQVKYIGQRGLVATLLPTGGREGGNV